MWVRFLKADRRRIRPVVGGVVTSVIHYKPGMVENVPREYGERLVAEGKAETTVSPRKSNDDAPSA
jgi:hypothetical protein